MMPANKKYAVGDKILCAYANTDVYYTAKIIGIIEPTGGGERLYKIHYQGWNNRFDEAIKESDTVFKWKEYTAEDAEASKTRVQELLQESKKAKKKDEARRSEGGGSVRRTSLTPTPSQIGDRPVEKTPARAREKQSQPEQHLDVKATADMKIPRKEITIAIPDVLKQILVDDFDAVNRQKRVNILPAKYTVEQIISDYATELGRPVCNDEQIMVYYNDANRDADLVSDHSTMMECSLGLQEFFDVTLASYLLTSVERPQYAKLSEEDKKNKVEPPAKKACRARSSTTDSSDENSAVAETGEFRPSKYYGLTHLLRLFVQFGNFIRNAPWSDRALSSIIRHVHDFLVFLARNSRKYYDRDAYGAADPAAVVK